MSAWLTPADGGVDRDRVTDLLRAARGEARWWSDAPGKVYSPHQHTYHKVLFCVSGSIVFVVDDEQLYLTPGDRLDIEPLTLHAAVVGAEGVTCGEVAVPSQGSPPES
jgi:quercetin dioxygenase-like cupin family protein